MRLKIAFASCLLFFSSLVLAANTTTTSQPAVGPEQLIQQTADQMIAGLQANKAQLKNNKQIVFSLVRKVVLPQVATDGMARAVLGKHIWQTATAQQKKEFVNQFTNLVIGTYASAFQSYNNETVKVFPIRGGVAPNQYVTQVKSIIKRSDGPDIPVSYNLVKLNNQWRIYDFSVEGVSLVQSFRSQFAAELSNGNLDSLISKLTAHNKQLHNG